MSSADIDSIEKQRVAIAIDRYLAGDIPRSVDDFLGIIGDTKTPRILSLAHKYLGQAYFFGGMISEAEESTLKSIEVSKSHLLPEYCIDSLNCLGGIYWNCGALSLALTQYEEAMSLDKDGLFATHKMSRTGVAKTAIRLGDVDRAKKAIEGIEFYEFADNYIQAYFLAFKADFLSHIDGTDPDAVEELFAQAISIIETETVYQAVALELLLLHRLRNGDTRAERALNQFEGCARSLNGTLYLDRAYLWRAVVDPSDVDLADIVNPAIRVLAGSLLEPSEMNMLMIQQAVNKLSRRLYESIENSRGHRFPA